MSLRKSSSLVPYKLSEKSYLLSDISRSNCPLPLPCFVGDGFYGASAWDTVSAGEVIFLNTLEKRRRALATDGQKHYSIPLDYPLKFSVIYKGNEYLVPSTKTIEEIVNHCKLPVTLKVDQRNTTLHLATNLRSILHLGNIDVTRTYDEKYFTGHAVIHNELQNETIMLPTFLKVRVRIIEGINGFSTAQWVDVLEAWKAIVKQAPSHAIKPPIDIVMFSSIPTEAESTETTTTTIERTTKEDIYETLEPTTYVKLNYNLAQRRSNLYTTLSTTAAPQQPEKTSKESTGDQETTKRQSTVASMVAATESSVKKSNPRFQKELQQTLSSRSPSESPRPGNRPLPPRVPQKLTKSLSEDPSRRRNPPTPSADTKPDKPSPSGQPSPSNAGQTLPPPLTPKTEERAVISESVPTQPEPSQSDPDVKIDPDYQISPRTFSRIHSLKDVPSSVAQLNIEEVADCLRLLKMAKYIDSFLANQVDGALLLECNEDILTNDLQMTSLHAKKLVMFAQKGWRPLQGAADIHL